jgi:hypothetical protein
MMAPLPGPMSDGVPHDHCHDAMSLATWSATVGPLRPFPESQTQFQSHVDPTPVGESPASPSAIVTFEFPAFVVAPTETGPAVVVVWVAVFPWVTVPSVPGLEIRTVTLVFAGAICVAVAVSVAPPTAPELVAVAVAVFV